MLFHMSGEQKPDHSLSTEMQQNRSGVNLWFENELVLLSTKMPTVRKKENGASFCHLWMGNLVVYIHLWLPVCTRQQQAAATSVAQSVAQSVSSTFWLIH